MGWKTEVVASVSNKLSQEKELPFQRERAVIALGD